MKWSDGYLIMEISDFIIFSSNLLRNCEVMPIIEAENQSQGVKSLRRPSLKKIGHLRFGTVDALKH